MNLRSQIHSAIDDVAPPAPSLEHDAISFAFSDGKVRSREPIRRQSGWGSGMRRAGSLVAAALIVVLMMALVVGGRIWRDSERVGPQPSIDQSTLAKLRAKPLNFVPVQPGSECPTGPFTQPPPAAHAGALVYGIGPVYAEGSGTRLLTSWGTYFETAYWVDPGFSGLALIRAQDLKTNQPVLFARDPYHVKAPGVPTGDMVGEDYVFGTKVQKYPELVLDGTHQSSVADPPGWWRAWGALQGLPKGTSGCIGFQADGAGFSESWVVSYLIV